jgi:hypothetical protein
LQIEIGKEISNKIVKKPSFKTAKNNKK